MMRNHELLLLDNMRPLLIEGMLQYIVFILEAPHILRYLFEFKDQLML